MFIILMFLLPHRSGHMSFIILWDALEDKAPGLSAASLCNSAPQRRGRAVGPPVRSLHATRAATAGGGKAPWEKKYCFLQKSACL